MNHQPFEDWLLNEKNLTTAERRELDVHLRTCRYCMALSSTGLALRSANVIPPAPGFTLRFEKRLAAQKIAERRRRLWGSIILLISGAGLGGWFTAPYLMAFANAPVEWVTTGIGYLLFIVSALHAFTEIMGVLLKIAPDFIPPYVWMVVISSFAGLCLLWAISIWRFSRTPQGVSA